MLSRILEVLDSCCGLHTESPILVGVSGGPDSICLLDVLVRAGFHPFVAHLDHGLRSSSRREASFVRSLSERYGLEYIWQRRNIDEYARAQGLSIEEAARIVRYRFLFSTAERIGSEAVLVAHNADDQVETILFHIIRGSSIAGLRGMQVRSLPNPWSQRLPLVRPLLGISRKHIMKYVSERQLPYILDESNQDERYTRNRIRHTLIPLMEGINPNVKSALQRMGELLTGDLEIIQSVIEKSWGEVCRRVGEGYVALDRTSLSGIAHPLQRHIFYAALTRILFDLSVVDYALIERACSFLFTPPETGHAELGAGVLIFIEADLVLLAREDVELPVDAWPQLPAAKAYELPLPGELILPEGWKLVAEIQDGELAKQQAIENRDHNTAWLDMDCLDLPLQVRPRKEGERISPFGMAGAGMKVSDYMINEKIPRRARDRWPLVVSGAHIAWVCGFTIGDNFRITSQTKRAVRLVLRQSDRLARS